MGRPSLIVLCLIIILAVASMGNFKGACASSGLIILSHQKYLDSYGFLHIVGEVQNSGTDVLTNVNIIATFYDSNGTTISTQYDWTHPELDPIGVSEKSPFQWYIYNYEDSRNVDHYSLTVSFSKGVEHERLFRIVSNSSFVDDNGFLHIVGEMQNIGKQREEPEEIIATLYDSAGNVALVAYDFPSASAVDVGQKVPFDILATEASERARIPLVASYTLTIQYSSTEILTPRSTPSEQPTQTPNKTLTPIPAPSTSIKQTLAPSTPTPTVPEFSWLLIMTLLIGTVTVTLLLRHRKNALIRCVRSIIIPKF
jgi:hypothetical protein